MTKVTTFSGIGVLNFLSFYTPEVFLNGGTVATATQPQKPTLVPAPIEILFLDSVFV